MWQRFTDRARKVVYFAQEEAESRGQKVVTTGHLLLGLLRESDNVATRVLERLGANPSTLLSDLAPENWIEEAPKSSQITLSKKAKKLVDIAYDEARYLNNNYIGTEHLLLGVLRQAEGWTKDMFEKSGVTLEEARRKVIEIQDGPVQGSAHRPYEPPHADPVPPDWKGAVSSLYMSERDTTRTGLLLLACFFESERLLQAFHDMWIDPELIAKAVEHKLVQRLIEVDRVEPTVSEVFARAAELGGGSRDPGFVVLAGLELDRGLVSDQSLPPEKIEALAEALRG